MSLKLNLTYLRDPWGLEVFPLSYCEIDADATQERRRVFLANGRPKHTRPTKLPCGGFAQGSGGTSRCHVCGRSLQTPSGEIITGPFPEVCATSSNLRLRGEQLAVEILLREQGCGEDDISCMLGNCSVPLLRWIAPSILPDAFLDATDGTFVRSNSSRRLLKQPEVSLDVNRIFRFTQGNMTQEDRRLLVEEVSQNLLGCITGRQPSAPGQNLIGFKFAGLPVVANCRSTCNGTGGGRRIPRCRSDN
jgi:hypothetical protein